LAGAENITFESSLYESTPAIFVLGSALTIASDLTITGPGVEKLILNAQGGSRVFEVTQNSPSAPKVTIANMKLTGGNAGAVRSNSGANSLALDRVWITGNTGGGISTLGALKITNSAITNNTGGDALNVQSGSGTLSNVTISDNISNGASAGIYFKNASATLTNVTVVNNLADADNNGSTTESGGLFLDINTSIKVYNSIVAQNHTMLSGVETAADVATSPPNSSIHSTSAYNLIGADLSSAFPTASGNSNQISVTPQQLALTELGFYGGAVIPVIAPKGGSLAIDAGDNAFALAAGLEFDQRGGFYGRFNDGDFDLQSDTDIGALELAIGEYYS
jgi:hypothetical protein